MYYIYKNKYDREIDSLSAKNKKKFDCKQLKISDDYWYTSDEEQEEKKNKIKSHLILKKILNGGLIKKIHT